jgi:hypothetical protein
MPNINWDQVVPLLILVAFVLFRLLAARAGIPT